MLRDEGLVGGGQLLESVGGGLQHEVVGLLDGEVEQSEDDQVEGLVGLLGSE